MNTNDLLTKEDFKVLDEKLSRIEDMLKSAKPAEHKEWYKSAEVKTILNCSDATLKNYRDSGQLPYSKFGGTYYYEAKGLRLMMAGTA